jgi:hypothetical protein
MEDYWSRIRKRLEEFCNPDDRPVCINVFVNENQTCELCGHFPIKWNFVLLCIRTNEKLIVGSECIKNYSKVSGKNVFFLKPYFEIVGRLNERWSDCAYCDEEEDILVRENLIDHGLNPDDPDFGELSSEGMHPDEIDWDSFDFE